MYDPQAIKAEMDEKSKLELQLRKQFVSDSFSSVCMLRL